MWCWKVFDVWWGCFFSLSLVMLIGKSFSRCGLGWVYVVGCGDVVMVFDCGVILWIFVLSGCVLGCCLSISCVLSWGCGRRGCRIWMFYWDLLLGMGRFLIVCVLLFLEWIDRCGIMCWEVGECFLWDWILVVFWSCGWWCFCICLVILISCGMFE